MDPCLFPLKYLMPVLVFAIPYFIGIFAVPSEYRIAAAALGAAVSLMVLLLSARQECHSDEATGGSHAPIISPAIANPSDLNAEQSLLIINEEKIPPRDVRLTIVRIAQADGSLAIENIFTQGREIHIGTVAPQYAPIRLPIMLLPGTYEIKIYTSRGIYSERLSMLPKNGQLDVKWRVTNELTNKVVRSSDE